ncbi:MAG: hypothetical protein LBF62_01285, partial [Tannerellaceae bacterium]|jgi:hypothetical protein|nr:hypothetical protein [Tannerellaceae bacterium]
MAACLPLTDKFTRGYLLTNNQCASFRMGYKFGGVLALQGSDASRGMTPNPTTINWENQYNRRKEIEQRNIFTLYS